MNEKKILAKLVKNCKIAVLGDFILDEYVWGTSERISPEAPVPIVKITEPEIRLGGAANVVNNLHAIGSDVCPITLIGGPQGYKLTKAIDNLGIPLVGIVFSETYANSHKIRIMAHNQQMLRLDNDNLLMVGDREADGLLENVSMMVGECDALVISDYKKGVVSPLVCQKAIQIARSQKIPVIVDPKGKDYSMYKGATVITPNEDEFALVTNVDPRKVDADILKLSALSLVKKLQLKALVLTRGEDGMTIFYADGDVENLPSHAKEVYDVTGAGDTVAAFLAASLCVGMQISAACKVASSAAGIAVSKVGTSVVNIKELLSDFPKLKDREELAHIVSLEQKRGKKVVFTNGCFDLLHVGHVQLLQKAGTLGDLLVVAINSDESISRIKGPDRPIIDEAERAQLLASLDCVDYVVVFDEDTPQEIIEVIKPDVLVKGKDYEDKDIVGREIVEANGGRVVTVDLVDGKSTTSIIEKIVSSYK